ncbi:hypothetical protein D9M73_152290 [compost metagenome]
MRDLGTEMPPEWIAERGPARGYLTNRQVGSQRHPRNLVELCGTDNRPVIPSLDFAKREGFDGRQDVVVITGMEDITDKSTSNRRRSYRQQWVCVEVPAP